MIMYKRSNKSGSDKTSSPGNFVANNNTQNLYTNGLKHLFIQRTPENDEDSFNEDDEKDDEEMQGAKPVSIQKKCTDCEEEERAQRSSLTPFLQTKTNDGGYANDAVSSRIQSTRGGGQAMRETTKNFMQSRLGA